jgi:hypothetical protein
MKTIKIYVAIDDTGMYQESNRFKGTYLHGELEQENKYDIFCFSEKLELGECGGLYHFIINGRPATFMLWIGELSMGSKWRGYLIYNNDEEYNWCLDNYNKRKQLI